MFYAILGIVVVVALFLIFRDDHDKSYIRNEQNVPCPFVGEIELERGSAKLIAEIKVIIPTSKEYVEGEIEDEL